VTKNTLGGIMFYKHLLFTLVMLDFFAQTLFKIKTGVKKMFCYRGGIKQHKLSM